MLVPHIMCEAKALEPFVGMVQLSDDFPSVVPASVVDQEYETVGRYLALFDKTIEKAVELHCRCLQYFLLVVAGCHDGQLYHVCKNFK